MPVRLPVAALVLALGLSAGVVLIGTLGVSLDVASSSAPTHRPAVGGAQPADEGALGVLRDWDVRRAAAWAAADPAALARLYTKRSSAGTSDVTLLRRYTRRGVGVPDLRMQLLQAGVLVDRPRRVVVRVVERLATGWALVGRERVALPRDSAQVRVVELRRVHGVWRVASVTGGVRRTSTRARR